MLHLATTLALGLAAPGVSPPSTVPPQLPKVVQPAMAQPLVGSSQGEVFLSNEVGMSMTLPEGSLVASRQGGPSPFFVVRDGAERPAWSLRLESVPSNDPTAETMIRRLMLTQGTDGPELEILEDRLFSIEDALGHLTWVSEKLPDGRDVIFGWMVLPQGRLEGQLHYIVATVITVPAVFELVQPKLERALESVSLHGPKVANLRAEQEAKATEQILAGLTKERLKALAGHRSFRRIYRPGPAGEPDQEVAYSIFSVEAAPMGTIQTSRLSDLYTPDEEEEGLLVRVHSRVVGNADRGIYMDMLGLYWVAWDLSHESWTASVTRRQGAATRHEKEFGFRTRQTLGQPRPRLVVIKQDDEINLREPYEWQVPEPWMPRTLTWTLGLLLPREKPVAMSYAFLDHRQSAPQLGTRRDEWTPQSPGDSTWILQTWLDDSGLPTTGEYGPTGLIRQRNPDGLIVEATSPERIEQLWKLAGLQTP